MAPAPMIVMRTLFQGTLETMRRLAARRQLAAAEPDDVVDRVAGETQANHG
jgi:hypothetical protein